MIKVSFHIVDDDYYYIIVAIILQYRLDQTMMFVVVVIVCTIPTIHYIQNKIGYVIIGMAGQRIVCMQQQYYSKQYMYVLQKLCRVYYNIYKLTNKIVKGMSHTYTTPHTATNTCKV